MAVARDANSSSPTENSSTTSHQHNGKITIGSGSNRAVIAQFITSADPGTCTAVLNPGGGSQTMTEVISATTGGGRRVKLFGLVAPTSGLASITITSTNAVESITSLTSYTGVDQTGGTTSFAHAASATGSSTTVSVTVTSAVDNMTVDCFTAPVGSATPTQTQLFFLSGVGSVDGGSSEAAGAASNTHQWTISSSAWGAVGLDLVQVGGGAAVPDTFGPAVVRTRHRAF